jgi:ATP-dependent Clp protease adaptor protein ClpS
MSFISHIPTPKTREVPQKEVVTLTEPRYHVILLDDDEHTYDYVIEICMDIFGMSEDEGYLKAVDVDCDGFVILLTTDRSEAEIKRNMIHSMGADWRMENCKGSMSAIIEPVRE